MQFLFHIFALALWRRRFGKSSVTVLGNKPVFLELLSYYWDRVNVWASVVLSTGRQCKAITSQADFHHQRQYLLFLPVLA
jgi:hypothetical protein